MDHPWLTFVLLTATFMLGLGVLVLCIAPYGKRCQGAQAVSEARLRS